MREMKQNKLVNLIPRYCYFIVLASLACCYTGEMASML